MECSCSASVCDEGEGYWNSREMGAAKPHKCCECGEYINKGDMFIFGTYIEPGIRIDNSITCMTCKDIEDSFFKNGHYVGQMLDNLFDYLWDSWGGHDLPSNCISKLTPAARDRVCDILQKFQEV